MPTLSADRYALDTLKGWPAGDSRELLFTVTTEDGDPKDISNDDLRWALVAEEYQSRSAAVVTDADSGVEIRTDVVDPTAGEFRVDVAEGTLAGEWGTYHQRVVVDPPGDSKQTWQGAVELAAVE
jgi:hypothetical protein